MTQEHPITPPPELVKQWEGTAYNAAPIPYTHHIARCAARWGADQELEACKEWVSWRHSRHESDELLFARRPKPPSLKELALEALDQADKGLNESEWQQRSDTIRRALESLPE